MKQTFVAIICILHASLSLASDRQDLSAAEIAAYTYVDVINSRDIDSLKSMIAFPDTQFYRDGRTTTYQTEDDYPETMSYTAELELISTATLDQSRDRTLLKVVFDRRDRGSVFRIKAWWAFRLVDGSWKISWRQVVHAEKIDDA